MQNEELTVFDWVEDNQLLRDEGICSGILGTGDRETEQVIQKYYTYHLQGPLTESVSLREQLKLLQDKSNSLKDRLVQARERARDLYLQRKYQPHHFYEYLLRTLIFSIVLVANFQLIVKVFGPRIEDDFFIMIGSYLFGSVAFLLNRSLLFEKNDIHDARRERVKTYIEEYILPLIVTLFIVFWKNPGPVSFDTLLFGLLIYTLFLFGGRGVLMSFTRMRKEAPTIFYNWRLWRQHRREEGIYHEKAMAIEQELPKYEHRIAEIERGITAKNRKIKLLEKESEAKLALFMREYQMAKNVGPLSSGDLEHIFYG